MGDMGDMEKGVRMREFLKHILEKFSSGRWLQTVAFTFTYCIVILGLTYMTIKKTISVDVFLAVWAGFTPLVILITEWYFKREDRKKEGEQK